MTSFDVVLVLGYFRTATAYLSIVRHLSDRLRLAVMATAASESLRGKTGETETLFVELCQTFGATIIQPGSPVHAELLIVQQFPYSSDVVAAIERSVTADRRVGLMALATAGLENHDAFITQFHLRKVYVPSRRLMSFLLERRGALERYRDVAVEEVGLPFAQYPVFPELSVDWLVAMPTLFSFSTEHGKQHFLGTVLRLVSEVPAGDIIAYKPHNGNAIDYFVPPLHRSAAAALAYVPGGERSLARLARGPEPLRRSLGRTYTSVLHRRLLARATPLRRLTKYADISLEAFLPGVRKGVIGGRSNTIWGTLYFGLPYYNCVDPSLLRGSSELINKTGETLLGLNMEYFGVPWCGGSLAGGSRGEDIVRPADRQGDLLRSIQCDLRLL